MGPSQPVLPRGRDWSPTLVMHVPPIKSSLQGSRMNFFGDSELYVICKKKPGFCAGRVIINRPRGWHMRRKEVSLFLVP